MTNGQMDVATFIQTNLPLVPVPAIPEICLHRAQPSSGLWRLAAADANGFGSPYWAYPWPGGLALGRHILRRPEIVRGGRVLDLGAGGGIVAIAAAKAGANQVIAAEIDPYATAVLGLNAAANGVSLSIITEDLTGVPPPTVDIVLVGDLFYEAALAERVTTFLDRCRADGIDVLIGDIGRAFLPMSRLRRIADYPMADFGEGGEERRCAVFAFKA